jgi:hypothetical protein
MKGSQLFRYAAGSAAAAGIGRPSIGRSASATTLKFVPYADLALFNPMGGALVTCNHVLMVFDMLFAGSVANFADRPSSRELISGRSMRSLIDRPWKFLGSPLALPQRKGGTSCASPKSRTCTATPAGGISRS